MLTKAQKIVNQMKNVTFSSYELRKLLEFYHNQYDQVKLQADYLTNELDQLKERQQKIEAKLKEEEEKKRAAKEKSRQLKLEQFKKLAQEIRDLQWGQLLMIILRQNKYFMTIEAFLAYAFNVLYLPKSHKEVIYKEIIKGIDQLEYDGLLKRFTPKNYHSEHYGLIDWFDEQGKPMTKFFKMD